MKMEGIIVIRRTTFTKMSCIFTSFQEQKSIREEDYYDENVNFNSKFKGIKAYILRRG
jgi:hypothetical protein